MIHFWDLWKDRNFPSYLLSSLICSLLLLSSISRSNNIPEMLSSFIFFSFQPSSFTLDVQYPTFRYLLVPIITFCFLLPHTFRNAALPYFFCCIHHQNRVTCKKKLICFHPYVQDGVLSSTQYTIFLITFLLVLVLSPPVGNSMQFLCHL